MTESGDSEKTASLECSGANQPGEVTLPALPPPPPENVPPPAGATATGPGMGFLLALQFVPLAALFVAVGLLLVVHEKYQKNDGMGRASEVSQYELKRLTASFNYRLNQLREEMLHLYGEQSNLARALNEAERERLVFFRREHLAAYAIMVQSQGSAQWDVQKYYVRDTANLGPEQTKEATALFKEALSATKAPGYWIKRVSGKLFGVDWDGGDAYGVAFSNTDENGKAYGFFGVFRASYVFPFCKFFGDALGAMPINVFVLEDRGRVVCHSQARFDGQLFKDYALYSAIMGLGPTGGQARYSNVTNSPVSASTRRLETGGLIFVAEAAEMSPWTNLVPRRELGMAAAAVALFTLIAGALSARAVTRRYAAPASVVPSPDGGVAPATDAMGVELKEFTKLRRELKEMETTVLDMQSAQAFLAGFQKAGAELPLGRDLARFVVDQLAGWGQPVVWLPAAKSDQRRETLELGPAAGWEFDKSVSALRIEIGHYAHPADLSHDEAVRTKVLSALGRDAPEAVIQSVFFQENLLGLLVFAGRAPQMEALPQISQVFALIAEARGSA